MPYGEFFIPNIDMQIFLRMFESVLAENKFKVKERKMVSQNEIFVKAVWGSKLKAFLLKQIMPFANFLKSAQRAGCEASVAQVPGGVVLRMYIVPYMELFDKKEMFLLSQSVVEKWTDERLTTELWEKVINSLMQKGIQLMQVKMCPNCKARNPPDARYCVSCGKEIG